MISDATVKKVAEAAYLSWATKNAVEPLVWESLGSLDRITWEIVARAAIEAMPKTHFVCACGSKLSIAEDLLPAQVTFHRCSRCRESKQGEKKKAGLIPVYDCTLGKTVWKKKGSLEGRGGKKKT